MLGRGAKSSEPIKMKARRGPRGLESRSEGFFGEFLTRKKDRRNDRLRREKSRSKRWKRGV